MFTEGLESCKTDSIYHLQDTGRISLGMHPANERRCYIWGKNSEDITITVYGNCYVFRIGPHNCQTTSTLQYHMSLLL